MHRWILFAAVACAATPTFDGLVAQHTADTDLPYADCGLAREEVGCTALPPGFQCLLDAFSSCEPARLDIMHATDDAGPLPETLFVEPRGAGCIVVSYQDHSGDGFKGDYGDVIHRECAAVAADGCVGVSVDGCTTIEQWDL